MSRRSLIKFIIKLKHGCYWGHHEWEWLLSDLQEDGTLINGSCTWCGKKAIGAFYPKAK
jgi:hypothetical protein